MFERLRSPEGPIYNGLRLLRLAEEEFIPEPVFKEIDDQLIAFEDHNTFVVECKDNPLYSCVMQITEYEDGSSDIDAIYHDASLIEELVEAGFWVHAESLEEARESYAFFLPDDYLDLAA